jgi:uncharacterized protein YggE
MMAMQMIERPWGIAAHGAASVRSAPDLVRARFKVIRLEQTPSRAFAAATKAVHAVREALRAHQVADSAVERSRLDLKAHSAATVRNANSSATSARRPLRCSPPTSMTSSNYWST